MIQYGLKCFSFTKLQDNILRQSIHVDRIRPKKKNAKYRLKRRMKKNEEQQTLLQFDSYKQILCPPPLQLDS